MDYQDTVRAVASAVDRLPALDQIKPLATFLVRSPESTPFVARQAALENVAQVFRKYMNQLPAELSQSLLQDYEQGVSHEKTVSKLQVFNAEAAHHQSPDPQWLNAAKPEQVEYDMNDPWNKSPSPAP